MRSSEARDTSPFLHLDLVSDHACAHLACAMMLRASNTNAQLPPAATLRAAPSHRSKLDVLPVIPVFTLGAAAGIPFLDKPVRVETLGKAMVAGMRDPGFRGVARVDKMEELAKKF